MDGEGGVVCVRLGSLSKQEQSQEDPLSLFFFLPFNFLLSEKDLMNLFCTWLERNGDTSTVEFGNKRKHIKAMNGLFTVS